LIPGVLIQLDIVSATVLISASEFSSIFSLDLKWSFNIRMRPGAIFLSFSESVENSPSMHQDCKSNRAMLSIIQWVDVPGTGISLLEGCIFESFTTGIVKYSIIDT
jgi:hypothetical protein